MSNFKLMVLLSAVGSGATFADCIFSSRPAGLLGLDLPLHQPYGRFPPPTRPSGHFFGMRKSSMFVDMPLDNRTVDHIAAVAACLALSDPLKTSPLHEAI